MESVPQNDDDGATTTPLADAPDAPDQQIQVDKTPSSVLPGGAVSSGAVDAESEPPARASTSDASLDPEDDLLAQLEREMAKRRPDRFLLGVLCRSLGGVPARFRTRLWKELLGVARNERLHLDQSILAVEEDLANQRVIAADASRTRGNDPLFKQPATVDAIGKILTFYCKSRNLRYKQGMNEVLAPFLMLERAAPLPEGVVFQLFYAMIDKFLPHVFVDRDFKSLQCSFQLFRLLMLYHDPKLCNYLDQHAMTPELYVTPWFMTLFARGLPEELVFTLWDFFLLHEDPYLLHYVAYALVETHRDAILEADVAMLPQVLSSISLDSRARVDAVCDAALELMDTTPRSYRRDLYSVCYGGYTNAMVPFLRQLMGASSLQVYPDELLVNLLSRLGQGTNGASPAAIAAMRPQMPELTAQKSFSAERDASLSSVFFIVLDCRPLEQYRECHLSLSYHVDPEIVGSPDALSVLIKGFTRMKGCHFCFVGPTVASGPQGNKSSGGLGFETINRITRGLSGERAQLEAAAAASVSNSSLLGVGTNTVPVLKKEHITVTRLVLMFLQKGFEHVSRLDGGFEELKQEIEKLDQFSQDQLLVYEDVASTDTATSLSDKSVGGLKLFAKKALDRVRTLSEDDPSSAIVAEGSSLSPSSAPPSLNIRAKTKGTVTTLSQRLQILTSAAKDAVAASAAGRVLQSPPPSSFVTQERSVVGEEEWMEVYTRTREALEKSLTFKEVVFQAGSLGILFQRSRHKKYLTVVDSLVPESQASESQQVEPGDLLVGVNGQDIADIPFQDVIDMIKDARRPLVLRLQNPKKKNLDTFDAISIPPLPPIMISASHHSICVSWNKLSIPNERYQLQYAKQSDYNFNPWISVPMKHESNAVEIDKTSGITTHHNGTLVGLEPGVSLVFRVRCGNNEKWGPYSLSSGPMTTLEKGDDEVVSTVPVAEASVTSPKVEISPRTDNTAVFLPGECPEFFERGTFFFRVVVGLRARASPAFDGAKLDIVLEKGTIVKCSERLVAPGTNQIFVRLCRDWNVAQRKAKTSLKKKGSDDDDRRSTTSSEEPEEFEVWAFENTPEGACVLERLPEFTEDMIPTAVPLQEQAKSLVSSFFSASGIKAPSSGTSTASTAASSATPSPPSAPSPLVMSVAPRVVSVAAASATEIKVTWEPVGDPSLAKYQIQYAKNRLTASWLTLKEDIPADSSSYTLKDLVPNVTYVFRVRASDDANHWGPFSETSEPCKTMEEPAVVEHTEEDDEATDAKTPRGMPPARDESEMIDSATAQDRSTAGFSSFFSRSTSTSSTHGSNRQGSQQPLRTGSTLLDKAVAAASKLSLARSDSGRRRRSSAAPPPSFEDMLEAVLPAEGDLIDVEAWKAELARVDCNTQSFQSVRYIPTIVVTPEPARTTQDIDPFAAIAASKAVAVDSVDPSVLETSSAQLTWNRVGDRELVVTRTALLALAKPSSHADAPDAVVETRRSLSALAKITSKKTVPNSVVFHFKRELTEMEKVAREADDEPVVAPIEQLCFVVEDKAVCVALVKENCTPDEGAA